MQRERERERKLEGRERERKRPGRRPWKQRRSDQGPRATVSRIHVHLAGDFESHGHSSRTCAGGLPQSRFWSSDNFWNLILPKEKAGRRPIPYSVDNRNQLRGTCHRRTSFPAPSNTERARASSYQKLPLSGPQAGARRSLPWPRAFQSQVTDAGRRRGWNSRVPRATISCQ